MLASMKKVAPLLMFGLMISALSPIAARAQEDQRIAFVDTKRAAATSNGGQAAQQRLRLLSDEKQAEFKPLQEELQRLRDEYETQRFVLSKEALQDREIEMVKMQRNLERKLEAAQEEFEIEQRKLMQPILKSIYDVAREVGLEHGYDMIIERSLPGVLYHSEQLDVTDELIERLNAKG